MQTRPSLFGRVSDRAANLIGRVLSPLSDARADIPASNEGTRPHVVPEVRVDPATIPFFRREMFPAAGPVPWLDRPDALARVDEKLAAGSLSERDAALARTWVRDGYVVMPQMFSAERIAAAWAEYEAAIAAGSLNPPAHKCAIDDPHPGRVLNPHLTLAGFDAMLRDAAMLDVIGMLLGVEPMPFQTLAGHKGTEQPAHSDTIHMTTYPLGYLVASWIALEDIHPDSGPLVYYPGSHRLPYLTSFDLGVPVSVGEARTNYDAEYHAKYEPAIARLIAEHDFEPAYFTPKAGDVLLWHANLLHGGSRRHAVQHTRKALVCHYFAEGCLTYHDLSTRPSSVLSAELERSSRSRR